MTGTTPEKETCTGAVDHIGIVTQVNSTGGHLCGDRGQHERWKGGQADHGHQRKYIRGFICPDLPLLLEAGRDLRGTATAGGPYRLTR